MKKILAIMTMTLFSSTLVFADGGSSGVGGGPVLGQAKALKMLLDSDEFLITFYTDQISTIKSIEDEGGSVYNGGYFYKVTSNGGCTMVVKFVNKVPPNSWEINLEMTIGKWTCP